MIGHRGRIFVIGFLVFLAAGGDCLVSLGDSCCREDWVMLTNELVKLYQERTDKANTSVLFTAMEAWYAEVVKNVSSHELEDLCGGFLMYKCVGPKNSSKCECSNDTGYVLQEGRCRIPEKMSVPCMGGLGIDQCMEGTCDVAKGKQFGVCKVGGVDNSKLMEKMKRISMYSGPGRREKLRYEKGIIIQEGTASYIQRPIMWVIIGGLSLISAASS